MQGMSVLVVVAEEVHLADVAYSWQDSGASPLAVAASLYGLVDISRDFAEQTGRPLKELNPLT